MKPRGVMMLAAIAALVLLQATDWAEPAAAQAGPPWPPGWTYRQSHVIQQTPGAGTDYQVKITAYATDHVVPAKSRFENLTKYYLGTPPNDNPVTVPRVQGAGAVHPDVHYFPGGYDGYEYWMAFTPYPPDPAEHPTIVRSHDGITWTDDGITNPVMAYGTDQYGTNLDADPDMIYIADPDNPGQGTWLLVWTVYLSGQRSDIALTYSHDGKNWTLYDGAPVNGNSPAGSPSVSNGIIMSGLDAEGINYPWESSGGESFITEPNLLYENGTIYLFYGTYIGGNNHGKVGYATFTWDHASHSVQNFQRYAGNPVIDLPSDNEFTAGCGHTDISKSGSTYYLYHVRSVITDGHFELGLLTSTDKIHWTNNGRVLQRSSSGDWDNVQLYRSCPVTDAVGNVVYYDGAGTGHVDPAGGSIHLYYTSYSGSASGGAGIGLAVGTDAAPGPPPTLPPEEVSLNGHARADFGDVRFTASNGNSLLPYWMESKVDGDHATFWVKVPDDLSAAPATIYVDYGKNDALSASNIKDASLWNAGDDFDDGTIDPQWMTLKSFEDTAPYAEESGGRLLLHLGRVAGVRALAPHVAENLEMSLQVHSARWVEMYLHNVAVTSEMLTGGKDAGDLPTNYRVMLENNGVAYAQKRLPDGTTQFSTWSSGSSDGTLKLRVISGPPAQIAFLVADHEFHRETWDPGIDRMCYVAIDGYGTTPDLTDWADNLWIRKYVEPEPAHGSWGAEENICVAPACDDGNPCTDDSCGPTGCVYTPVAGRACEDGSVCTTGDTCDATGACAGGPVVQAGVTCRPAAGPCDIEEACDGTSPACPPDALLPATMVCRGSAGDCDPAETCSGASAACPADRKAAAGTVCRPAVGLCDLVEHCDGSSDRCPPDVILPNGTACSDGDACTIDTCAAGVCLIGPPSCTLGGSVRYYRDSAGTGSEPTDAIAKVVPHVRIRGSMGSGAVEATTNASGAYALGLLDGDVSVQPLSKWGAPRGSDEYDAVTSFDATLIARKSVGLIGLTTNQSIAADVSGNGEVSSYDAALVAQFVVGLIDHFEVATATGSDWRFEKATGLYPNLSDPVFSHAPLTGPVTDDFYAILYGDVTGNWVASTDGSFAASRVAISFEEGNALIRDRELADRFRREGPPPVIERQVGTPPAELSLVGWKPLRAGERRQLTVDLRNADGILGLDLVLTYDPSRIAVVDVRAAGIGSALSVARSDERGSQRIAAYGYAALSGSGSILTITVEGLNNKGRQLSPTIGGAANEGAIPLVVKKSVQVPRMEP